MFYAHIVLAKKGPLARIWLAAHWDKKLTKAQVFETDIEQSVEGIMQPKVKLALRTSGHLLLGVVRIYSRKAKYLLADCNEAFVKIKMAFRPGIVDLPEGHREAAVNAITLPEVFHDFDTALPELNDVDIEAQFSINQSRADEITMREDYGSLSMSLHEDGFGDMGFEAETPDLARDGIEPHIDEQLFGDELAREIEDKEPVPGTSKDILEGELPEHGLDEEEFGDEFGQPAAGLFEGDIFGEPHLPQPEPDALPPHDDMSDDGLDHFDEGAPPPSPPTSEEGEEGRIPSVPPVIVPPEAPKPVEEHPAEEEPDQTTLLQNEEESFALAPVDVTQYKGVTKAKRKRKLIVDEVKNISGEEMKSQLANTSDILTTLDLAPPTKRLMYWKETGGVEKLFALPAREIPAKCLFALYQRHLISRVLGAEEYPMLGPSDVLGIDLVPEQEAPAKRVRKRKLPVIEEPEAPETPQVPQIPEVSEQQPEVPQDSVGEPEPMREHSDVIGMSAVSLDLQARADDETLMPPPATPVYEGLLPEISSEQLPTVPMTPNIEHIESIPQLSADQVNSILNAEEGIGDGHMADLDYGDLLHEPVDMPKDTRDIVNDWTDIQEFPPIGEQPDEEQLENETGEEFEERVLNKRAAQMFVAIKKRLQKRDTIYFSEMTQRNTRKQAAQKFYSLLVLKKFRALEIEQDEPYGDIQVNRGPMFDNPQL